MSRASRHRAPPRPSVSPPTAPLAPLALVPPAGVASAARELWAALQLGAGPTAPLEALAEQALSFTPRVSLEPPDALLLEVQGSLKLFGGVEGLRAALQRNFGVAGALALAPTPLAALLLVRGGRHAAVLERARLTGQLASLPLQVLRWPDERLERLKRVGVRTLGALLRLPRGGFAQRFGVAALRELDQVTGRLPTVRHWFQAPLRFRRRRELCCELEDHERLLLALEVPLTELERFLRSRGLGVAQLQCQFLHRQLPPTLCELKLAAPATRAAHLSALLQERLRRVRLPAPVRALELRTSALLRHGPPSASLWQPGEQGGAAVGQETDLIERLRVRLGEDCIHGLRLHDDHRPERAFARTEPPSLTRATPTTRPPPPAARPLWLLPAPQPLALRAGVPQREGPLRLLGTPERIESGWWDGEDVVRDYYTALDVRGARLWVYRERRAPHGWFLQGIFG
ncbi:MAG: DNA polymerase Y family protein [Gammaproteobacteria bacterium]|nr:DNA polymerase Y family protein [Gammaproteobacteria bacterium]